MDWETFFQGLKDTRTGGGLFVVTLLLFLLAPFGFCLLAEGVAAGWAWLTAVASGGLDFVLGVDYLEVATITVRCTLFLSLIGLAALVLIITRDRFQRSSLPTRIHSIPRTHHSSNGERREDS